MPRASERTSRVPIPRPPRDAHLAHLTSRGAPDGVSRFLTTPEKIAQHLAHHGLRREDRTMAGHEGDPVEVSVVRPTWHTGHGPALLHLHGGGMIFGSRFDDIPLVTPWLARHAMTLVTVEYRLAPQHPDPYPVEDCYAALEWVRDRAADIGVDPRRIVLVGASAGAGLAAGVSLLARDRGGPTPLGQMLLYPMLDDRGRTVSTAQMDDRDGDDAWHAGHNADAWASLLGERAGTDRVSPYAAPARASDLSGLSPTYLDCGSVDVFRDETVAYASALWQAGVAAELHIWAGGTHLHEMHSTSPLAASARQARSSWLRRLLAD